MASSAEHFRHNPSGGGQHNSNQAGFHQRTKSSGLRSLLHRRNNSDGSALPSSISTTPIAAKASNNTTRLYIDTQYSPVDFNINSYDNTNINSANNTNMGFGRGVPLGEFTPNQQDQALRSPRKLARGGDKQEQQQVDDAKPKSPRKNAFSTISLKSLAKKDNGSSGPSDRDGSAGTTSPAKPPKKIKSSTNLAGLLSRPKSSRNLKKQAAAAVAAAAEEEAAIARQLQQTTGNGNNSNNNKENRTPPGSVADAAQGPPPPIYAQFCRDASSGRSPFVGGGGGDFEAPRAPYAAAYSSSNYSRESVATGVSSGGSSSGTSGTSGSNGSGGGGGMAMGSRKPRPVSYHPHNYHSGAYDSGRDTPESRGRPTTASRSQSRPPPGGQSTRAVLTATAGVVGPRGRATGAAGGANDAGQDPFVDPKDIDRHLDAMLDRRNIPENQRYKMRNLADTVKMEFIRQDWAETAAAAAAAAARPGSGDSNRSTGIASAVGTPMSEADEARSKRGRSRGRSFTVSRSAAAKTPPATPAKSKKGRDKSESSIGRHFRTKSTDSVNGGGGGGESAAASPAVVPPHSAGSGSGGGSSGGGVGFLAKLNNKAAALQQGGPADFVAYLRKVRQPQQVEVGRLHKLRLLLRNETVAWTDEFVRQGGMKEIVDLLHRIMEVEWREEHEDALLHENLLCLKALCTTDLALEYLHSIHGALFPALLHMLFDPEKKGPSEFTTRNIITSILFTYIQSASPAQRVARAATLTRMLRDPEPDEAEKPLPFVLEMRRERPYRVWCKEVTNVTKEVFWIFLHNTNVVTLPKPDPADKADAMASTASTATAHRSGAGGNPPVSDADLAYQALHFPRERAPVAAAPYVGGVEWDATNYLASHLDLLNALLACTPAAAARLTTTSQQVYGDDNGTTTTTTNNNNARNALRDHLRASGWERVMGSSLRTCKEKFYGGVHEALRTWAHAGHADGWDVRDVRFGPPPKHLLAGGGGGTPASPARGAAGRKKKKDHQPPPKLHLPALDIPSAPLVATTSGDAAAAAAAPWGRADVAGFESDLWLS